MRSLAIASLLAVLGNTTSFQDAHITHLWASWKQQHGKSYHQQEEGARLAIFKENLHKIQKYNAKKTGVRLGLNQFSDLTSVEFKSKYTGGKVTHDTAVIEANKKEFTRHELSAPPLTVDWRKKGAITPIKDQQQCGSCWTFSTTGVLEGRYFIDNNQLLSFSEQQIVDCDNQDGNAGCGGGWPYLAVDYVAQNGIELESAYPYTGEDGDCQFDQSQAYKVTAGYQFVQNNSRSALKAAIVQQPVSILIEADEDVFQSYTSGVITQDCGAEIDHAVLAVGYTVVGKQEAYIVKNSWGTSWGQKGYVMIGTDPTQNDGQGVCGILYQPVIAQPLSN